LLKASASILEGEVMRVLRCRGINSSTLFEP
jgi:hypothetical protein